MAHWNSTSATSRLVAASVALGVTVGLFVALTRRNVLVDRRGELQRTTVFLLSPRPVQLLPRLIANIRPQANQGVGKHHEASIGMTKAVPQATEHTAAASEAPMVQGAEPENSRASAPIRMDSQALHRAIASAEGNIQRLARSSGVELNTRRPTQSELLSSAIAETGVPDCLAPNAGGSLLSIPIIAYMAVKGKCK